MQKSYSVLGLMSGTSLDGVDAAFCNFFRENGVWNFRIDWAQTYEYEEFWQNALRNAQKLSGLELTSLDRYYGNFLAGLVNQAISQSGIKPSLIASHGHTIFHNPAEGYTLQIGNWANIAALTGISVVSDFRSIDIALGGQGAPLVPFGDKMLFNQYKSCLNLGGFANISFDENNLRKAFDICPVNLVMNKLARSLGSEFDDEGKLGRNGIVDSKLLSQLNALSFYSQPAPKSLGREWLESEFIPILDKSSLAIADKMKTVYEHIATQITNVINFYTIENVLVTGGGAYNKYLLERIQEKTKSVINLPENQIIEFKEALVFAFLGLMRELNEVNCYASVTGAVSDSVCGVYYRAKNKKVGDSPLSNPNYKKQSNY